MFIYSEGDGDPLGVFERMSNVTICSADLRGCSVRIYCRGQGQKQGHRRSWEALAVS